MESPQKASASIWCSMPRPRPSHGGTLVLIVLVASIAVYAGFALVWLHFKR